MSYKRQVLEWDVPSSEVQVGIPVGYEVEFSLRSLFQSITYSINTFDEVTASLQGVFFYSTDGGETWVDFPVGESGQAFYAPYKIRLIANASEFGYIFAEKNGTIYRVRGDAKEVIDSYTIGSFTSTGFDIDIRDNTLYVSGQEKTLYKIATDETLRPSNYSINIRENPLGIVVDGSRDSFWQVERDQICLKKLSGETVFCLDIPYIDVDYSSSSSSSNSSGSSSSSSSSISSESSSSSSSISSESSSSSSSQSSESSLSSSSSSIDSSSSSS